MADSRNHETWKNNGAGRHFLKTLNSKGEFTDLRIDGNKTFHISPEDRRINQEIAANEELDMFKNGAFSPVRLIESDEDTQEIASNPNLMTEDDMKAIFKGNWKVFDKQVADISNSRTLDRLLEVAHDIDATVRQVDAIRSRQQKLSPVDEEVVSDKMGRYDGVTIRPVTPN